MRSPRPERHPGAANAVLVLSSRSATGSVCGTAGSSRGIPPFDFERPFCGAETVTGRALRFGVLRHPFQAVERPGPGGTPHYPSVSSVS